MRGPHGSSDFGCRPTTVRCPHTPAGAGAIRRGAAAAAGAGRRIRAGRWCLHGRRADRPTPVRRRRVHAPGDAGRRRSRDDRAWRAGAERLSALRGRREPDRPRRRRWLARRRRFHQRERTRVLGLRACRRRSHDRCPLPRRRRRCDRPGGARARPRLSGRRLHDDQRRGPARPRRPRRRDRAAHRMGRGIRCARARTRADGVFAGGLCRGRW